MENQSLERFSNHSPIYGMSIIFRSFKSNQQSSVAPTIGPIMEPSPPTTTMARNMMDIMRVKISGSINLKTKAYKPPAIPA